MNNSEMLLGVILSFVFGAIVLGGISVTNMVGTTGGVDPAGMRWLVTLLATGACVFIAWRLIPHRSS